MKFKRYEFWFCRNIMYNCETIKLVKWYSKPLVRSGCFILWKCFIVTNLGVDEAFKIAKEQFKESGFEEQIMGIKI